MLKKYYAILAGFFLTMFTAAQSFAAGLVDSTMMDSIKTDALADIALVGGTILLIMGALVGLFFAIRAMRKSGG